jgi:hypothetical protein
MLLFRSEETVGEWCSARGLAKRPLVSLDQVWVMAREWYGNRLTVDSRRPGPDEMVEIFARIGLTGPFWDPKSGR